MQLEADLTGRVEPPRHNASYENVSFNDTAVSSILLAFPPAIAVCVVIAQRVVCPEVASLPRPSHVNIRVVVFDAAILNALGLYFLA